MKVCILGAGVIGVSAAYHLSRSGCEVLVIDRQQGPGLETSFANGGQLSASNSAPWGGPEIPILLIKWFGKKDAPLLYHYKIDPVLWRWTISFLRNCSATKQRAHTIENLKLAIYSRRIMNNVNSNLKINYNRKKLGILEIYQSMKTMDKGIENATELKRLGSQNKVLGQKSCLELEPALKGSEKVIVGGIHTPDDESGDAHKFTQELANACKVANVQFKFGELITNLETDKGKIISVITDKGKYHADKFVVSLGSYSPLLLKTVGIRLPVYPAKGYSVTIPVNDNNDAPNLSITDADNKIVYSRLGNQLRVAGTAEFDGYNTSISKDRTGPIISNAKKLFPKGGDFENSILWTGLRPLTPDGIPVIGQTKYDNLYLNTGHGTLGWTLGAGSGKAISDIVCGKSPDIDIGSFSFSRF